MCNITTSLHSFVMCLLPATQQEHSFVTTTDGASVCARSSMCEWSVCCYMHTKRPKERCCCFFKAAAQPRSQKSVPGTWHAAVQQKRYNGSRAPSSRVCASSHGVCVWLVHSSRRSNGNIIFMPSATVKHTSSDLIPGTRSIYTSSKHSSPYSTYHWNGCVALFRLATPSGHQDNQVKPIPKGNVVVCGIPVHL